MSFVESQLKWGQLYSFDALEWEDESTGTDQDPLFVCEIWGRYVCRVGVRVVLVHESAAH